MSAGGSESALRFSLVAIVIWRQSTSESEEEE